MGEVLKNHGQVLSMGEVLKNHLTIIFCIPQQKELDGENLKLPIVRI
jgi:hypothetical protein